MGQESKAWGSVSKLSAGAGASTGAKWLGLPAARAFYAALSGLGLLQTSRVVSPDLVGAYAVRIAGATFAALAIGLGVDRVLARRLSTDQGSGWSIVRSAWIRLRITTLVFAVAIGFLLTILGGDVGWLAVSLFAATRAAFVDLEAVAVSVGRHRRVFLAAVINGAITGGGLLIAGTVGGTPSWMISASALGNVIGGVVLGTPGTSTNVVASTRAVVFDAFPYLLMGGLALVYQRADLVSFAVLGTDFALVGSYALAIRGFELLATLRAAVSQQLTIELLRTSGPERRGLVFQASSRLLQASVVIGSVLIVGGTYVIDVLGLSKYPMMMQLIIILGAICPLLASHGVTSAAVFAAEGRRRAVATTAVLAGVAFVVTMASAAVADASGALAATGALEWLSACAFWGVLSTTGALHHLDWIRLLSPWPVVSAILAVPLVFNHTTVAASIAALLATVAFHRDLTTTVRSL